MIERTFILDLQGQSTARSDVRVNQGNVGSVAFLFRIFDGANEVDYSAFDEARITLAHRGRAVLNSPCEIDTVSRAIRYTLEPEALGRDGTISGQLDLSADGMNLATLHFDFFVVASLANMTEGERKAYINEFSAILSQLTDATAQVELILTQIGQIEDANEILLEALRLLDLLKASGWVSVGTVETATLAAGEKADVYINADGNVLNFTFAIPVGAQGLQGIQGIQGIQGVQGLAGAQGEQGQKGETGAQGVQGVQGERGLQGEQGETGAKGETGAQGIQGIQGIQGLQGIQGYDGPPGPQGIQGQRGESGKDGSGVNILGSYETEADLRSAHPTGNAGDAYMVQADLWVWSATLADWTNAGNIQGPKGETGEIGPAGAQGIQGIQGERGLQGLTGEQGVRGEQGIQGIQGERGLQGERGEQGIQGIQGIEGERGQKGDTGEQGAQGIQGEQGIEGPQGIQGEIGPQGAKGYDGPQGPPGATGPQGQRGEQGLQGIQGQPGNDAVLLISDTDWTPETLPVGSWGGVY